MSAATEIQTLKISKTIPMQVTITGRIEAVRRWDQLRYTRIITPAADVYSRPQVVEVRSKDALGQKGDEITIVAMLGGFTRRPYKVTDKESGEVVTVTPIDMTLDVVD